MRNETPSKSPLPRGGEKGSLGKRVKKRRGVVYRDDERRVPFARGKRAKKCTHLEAPIKARVNEKGTTGCGRIKGGGVLKEGGGQT